MYVCGFVAGSQLKTLNQHHQLIIGSATAAVSTKWQRKRHNRRHRPDVNAQQPFVGVVSGLHFNGLYPLDAAARKDKRIKQMGDVAVINDVTASGGDHKTPTDDNAPANDNNGPDADPAVWPSDGVSRTAVSNRRFYVCGSSCSNIYTCFRATATRSLRVMVLDAAMSSVIGV